MKSIFCSALIFLLSVDNSPAATLYVSQASRNPRLPYGTWATAATNIQDAVDAASAGDTVLVTNGVYTTGGRTVGTGTLTNRVTVDKSVTLRSVNGPESSIIQGNLIPGSFSSPVRCGYLAEGAVLDGFTLSNGLSKVSFFYDTNYDSIGAGVYCGSTNAMITNCVMSGNSSSQGGAVYGGTLINCVLTNNNAYSGGGCYGSILTNCLLSRNGAWFGAGVYASTLSHCTLTGNAAGNGEGGGANSSVLFDCTLTGNSATNGTAAKSCTLYNSFLSSNALYSAAASECTLHNCALTGNANVGAAGSTLYNCTLTENQHGAWYSDLYNCILYHNTAAAQSNYDDSCTLNFCCTTPAPTNGIGNITNDPALSGSWRISSSSPCRGAGSAAYVSGVDLDGEPWLNPPSIGCDEFYSGSITGALSVVITAAWTNVATGFSVGLDGVIAGAAGATRWEFGDGTIQSNRLHTAHQWSTPGTYNVVLRAYNNDNPAGVTASISITVVTTPVLYVDINNPQPIAPYTTWGTAATNIHDAVQAAPVPGAVVIVTNGVYRTGGDTTNRVTVNKPMRLQSVNGPQATIIEGHQASGTPNGGGVRCVYLASGAVLNGFTLTGGATSVIYDAGGGVYCESSSCIVTNCVMMSNSSSLGGGVRGGTLYDCTLASNSVSFAGGGAEGSTLNRCILSNNVATTYGDAGGADSSALNDCLLVGNTALNGGGAKFSTLNNCMLIGNTAVNSGGGAINCVLNSCLLTGNVASNYGAGGASGSALYNCTLTGNTGDVAHGSGGGAYNSQLSNCIVYSNTPPNYSESTLNFCCTTPLPASGTGNIDKDPLFVDLAGGNLHLQFNSPCINRGNNAAVFGTTDLDGNPRIVGGFVDLGAYEFQGTAPPTFYTWLQSYGLPTDGSADYADSDGDGLNNWQEWVCGTDPSNAISALRMLSALQSANNGITVTWQSVAGITYSLERSTNSDLSFTTLATNIAGQAAVTSYSDNSATGVGPFFYRIVVPHP